MSEINETEIRRRADGSIDTAFYMRRARLLRAKECQALIASPWSVDRAAVPRSYRHDASTSDAPA